MMFLQCSQSQQPTTYCPLPTAYCPLPTAYCLLPTAYCLLPTAHCLLPTAYCLQSPSGDDQLIPVQVMSVELKGLVELLRSVPDVGCPSKAPGFIVEKQRDTSAVRRFG